MVFVGETSFNPIHQMQLRRKTSLITRLNMNHRVPIRDI